MTPAVQFKLVYLPLQLLATETTIMAFVYRPFSIYLLTGPGTSLSCLSGHTVPHLLGTQVLLRTFFSGHDLLAIPYLSNDLS